ncbi:hypothetical protein, partial [Salmonella enterica]|uniref:hypothetical protein n=1 Tax=Salmonella enterica TaxID=28901 RepID=UPI003298EABA
MRCLELLGGQPIGQVEYEALVGIVDEVWKERPDIDAIFLKSVMESSSLWDVFARHEWRIGRSN